MGEAKTAKFQFGLEGLFTKVNPELLHDSQYRALSSMDVIQEGSLASRSGRKSLGTMPAGTSFAYMIRKMVVTPGEDPGTPSVNPRYIGVAEADYDLYRTLDYSTFTQIATGINTAVGSRSKGFRLANYTAGASGGSWAFIASELKMLKDRGTSPYASPLPRWGILPAFGVALAVEIGAGNLNGGSATSPVSTQKYDYRFAYLGADTNNEGNPSQTMLDDSVAGTVRASDGTYTGTPIGVDLKSVRVTVQGTGDTQISNIAIYRRGGILFDAWRLVGRVTNPGAGATATFDDNIADVDLVFAPTLELDNDPPVTSTVKTPITAKLTGPSAVGRQTIAILSGSLVGVTPGSTLHFFYDAPEDVIVEDILTGPARITAYFQHAHINGADMEVDALTAQPAYIAISYGQFVIVAGDPNNPNILYRSKGGRPEAFAAAPDDGTTAQVSAGTPGNPIMDLANFRGHILSLNLSSLYETLIISGSLYEPQKVAEKGLVASRAWCQTETEIWFLSTDGVYSWDGGSLRKRTMAIDPLFHGQQVNGMSPLAYDVNGLKSAVMEYRHGEVHLMYSEIAGPARRIICEPSFNDRWRPFTITSPVIDFIYTEPDTGSMVEARFNGSVVAIAMYDRSVVSGGKNYTSDYFTTDPTTQGDPIPFSVSLPWIDMGMAHIHKLFEEIYLDLDTSDSSATPAVANLTVETYLDFSETVVDTFGITIPIAGRTLVSMLPRTVAGTPITTFGREARAISFRISGAAYPARIWLFSLLCKYQETGELTAGGATDWMNLGHKFDKRLYQMTVEFDTAGVDRTLIMDSISGREGKTLALDIQRFTLSNAAISGAGRALKTFPVADPTILKEVRLRPVPTTADATKASGAFFKIINVDFEKELYPPDVVTVTPWEDGGLSYLKYANQITLEVNTNNIAVTVKLQADGSDRHTFTVQSTESDRERNITLPTGLTGYRWRLFVDPAQNAIATLAGMFQLFNHSIKFQQADRGEVGHSFDWDDLGHPWDKYLRTVTYEWDNTGGADVVMDLDILYGIGGQGTSLAVSTFTLSGGRGKRVSPLPADTICKMIRFHPHGSTIPVGFKQWKYSFDKEDFPADIVASTPWRDAETPNDKNPSLVWVDVDTESVAASVQLVSESASVLAFSPTTNKNNRKREYAIPADNHAKMWRLLSTAGVGGKFQLFSWGFNRWTPRDMAGPDDPPDVTLWTPWSDFGYPYSKIARNLIITVDTGGVVVPVQLQTQEGGTVQTLNVTGSYANRRTVTALNPDLIGKLWRLVVPNATISLFKLWDWSLEVIKEPAAVLQWSSYEQTMGSKFFKFLFQGWWMYTCASPITLTIVADTGTFTIVLPAHPGRDTERFYLPDVFGAGLNKSILYRVNLSAATPFKFYMQGSGIEWMTCGQDRHAGYQQSTFAELMGLGEG